VLNINNIAGGAVEEKFQVELDRVLKNINDPNAKEGKRDITLKMTFKPNSAGTAMDVVVESKSSLQPDLAVATMAFLGKENWRRS
jgi:hypothetical protein